MLKFWLGWQGELETIRVLDPACGSGAFLIEAFDQLHAEYERANERVRELRGGAELFDLDRLILQLNLYGVDLNEEAVHTAKLSLWIKTAVPGKVLTSLDHNFRVGNSLISDGSVDPKAFDWRAAFPEVFGPAGKEGFDVVIGNPPYIRQEWISPIKPYLQSHYRAYHGMADLYVYFYELGLNLLRAGGRLSFVVTNKWLKAGYGEPLRRLFAEKSWVESIVDFGHAKQIFEDADVFPSIIVAQKPTQHPAPLTARACAIPREQLRISNLSNQIASEGFDIERGRLGSDAWSLEPKAVAELLAKVRANGKPLSEFAAAKPYRGILTGYNEAFLIDSNARDSLISESKKCSEVIKPYVRGQDIKRWHPDWAGLWMIVLKSSENQAWPWSNVGEIAENVFRETYPSLYVRLKPLEEVLRKRQDKGRNWWELRSCAYWDDFERPKLLYKDITWRSSFCLDMDGTFSNNTVYFLPTADRWVLAVLNSPIGWWFAWREAQHGKDEALRYFNTFLEKYPIPQPSEQQRINCENIITGLTELSRSEQNTVRDTLDWLKVEHEIDEPSTRLQNPISLDSDSLISEVRRLRGKKKPLSLAALRNLRDEHTKTLLPAQALAAEARGLEQRVSDLVNEAYGLTPDEVRLMWETAPPRMPIAEPKGIR